VIRLATNSHFTVNALARGESLRALNKMVGELEQNGETIQRLGCWQNRCRFRHSDVVFIALKKHQL